MEESARYAHIVVVATIALLASVSIFATIEYEAYLERRADNSRTETKLRFVLVTQLVMIVIQVMSSISFFLILSQPNSLIEVIFWATVGIAYAYFVLTVACLVAILFPILIRLLRKR